MLIFWDAMKVIKVIKGAENWVIKNLVEDILSFLFFLRKLIFFFIPKKFNGAAHCPAKFILEKKENLSGGFALVFMYVRIFMSVIADFFFFFFRLKKKKNKRFKRLIHGRE